MHSQPTLYEGFLKWWVSPPNHPFVHRVFHEKKTTHPYFWKHQYRGEIIHSHPVPAWHRHGSLLDSLLVLDRSTVGTLNVTHPTQPFLIPPNLIFWGWWVTPQKSPHNPWRIHGTDIFTSICLNLMVNVGIYIYVRVEQKVHERGFLCVSLWVCDEQSRLKFFFWNGERFFVLSKVLAKVHVDVSKFALYMYLVFSVYVSFCKNYWVIFRKSLAKV